MDWQNFRAKRSSLGGVPSYNTGNHGPGSYPSNAYQSPQFAFQGHHVDPKSQSEGQFFTPSPQLARETRTSHFESQFPLYSVDWTSNDSHDWVALSTFREGFQNRIQVLEGSMYRKNLEEEPSMRSPSVSTGSSTSSEDPTDSKDVSPTPQAVFDWTNVADVQVDYPLTNIQWDPLMLTNNASQQRLAASSEVLRLYRVEHNADASCSLVQTHLLANNSTVNSSGGDAHDINTFPPVTSFDWNVTDPNTIITLSVDTTCTVWDLNRSHNIGAEKETAHVKTQLIAHDSEVFDVKFLNNSTNIFASVSNDGSMRVFDLRSLEHSTIIYEPTLSSPVPSTIPGMGNTHYNPHALLKLLTSNIDQHHLATIGVNLNQVLIIDMRMPGLPVLKLDCLFGGMSNVAVNLIQWHPSSNLLATGGDDCQAVVWDCAKGLATRTTELGTVMETPSYAYEEDLEVNNVCWRKSSGNWLGTVSGKSFQALQLV